MNFYITFGQKYRYEEHPANQKTGFDLHPDGYVLLTATDVTEAIKRAAFTIGLEWSGIYQESPGYGDPVFDRSIYPRGCIGQILFSTMVPDTVLFSVPNKTGTWEFKNELIAEPAIPREIPAGRRFDFS